MKRPQTRVVRHHPGAGRSGRLVLLCLAVALAAGIADRVLWAQQFDDFTPVTDAVLQDPDPADWLHWRRTLDAWGHSPLDEITPDNADQLRLIWSWALAEGSQQTTPMVYNGVMYIANPGELVQALDAATGESLWEYRRQRAPTEDHPSGAAPNRMHRNLSIYQDKIYLNTTDAHVVAIDARTGAEVWGHQYRGRGRLRVHERLHHRRRQGGLWAHPLRTLSRRYVLHRRTRCEHRTRAVAHVDGGPAG